MWQLRIEDSDLEQPFEPKLTQVRWRESIGTDEVKYLTLEYKENSPIIRLAPQITLKDIDGARYIFMANSSLVEKIERIHILANEYKLGELSKADLAIDRTSFEPGIPCGFSTEELSDPWVRIRPSDLNSTFRISFSERTPKRLFEPKAG